jgi:drug/metabolite transporter (DMT)-like permease
MPPLVLLFAALIGWGCFPLVRRATKTVNGQLCGMYSFTAELCLVGIVTGCAYAATTDSSFHMVPPLTKDNAVHWAVLFLGGCLLGIGDAVAMTALANVPASIGFPVWVGVCTATGVTIGYVIDGSPNPSLLFGGVSLFVCSVVVQAMTSGSGKEGKAGQGSLAVVVDVEANVEAVTVVARLPFPHSQKKEASPSTPTTSTPTTPTLSDRQWVMVCIAGGLWNSLWSPAATFGRRPFDSTREVCTLFLLGRVCVQPCFHCLLWLSGRAPSAAPFVDAWRLTRTEKLASLLCGLLLAGSFFLYFEGSKSVNKTAAFSIGNCCPVFTVAAGILLGDLKGSNWRETMGVVGSIFLFVGALVLLTLASAEPEE